MISKRKAFLYWLFLLPASLPAQRLYVGNNTTIVMSVSRDNIAPKMVLNNMGFINDGVLKTDTGTVIFTGDAGPDIAVIGGATTTIFYNLVINKSSGNVALVGQANVIGRLIMNNGNLLLNNHTLDLGTTGSLAGEKDQSRVAGNGYIMASRVLNAPKFVNLGNLGMSITSSSNMGIVTVLRSNSPVTLPGGAQSIARSYTVYNFIDGEGRAASPLPPPTSRVFNFNFRYLNAELNGLSKPALNVWSGGPVIWTFLGKTSEDTANNLVTKNGMTSLGTFYIGPASASGARAPQEEPTVAQTPGSVQLFPNPAHDHCTLVLYASNESSDIISLYSPSGSVLQQKHVELHTGPNNIDLDLRSYAAGVYWLRSENNAFKSIQIMKQ